MMIISMKIYPINKKLDKNKKNVHNIKPKGNIFHK